MKIYIKIYATLRQYLPRALEVTDPEGLDVEEDTTVTQVMERLQFPESLRVLALVNGVHTKEDDTVLKDGDKLLIYPLMSGG
jgi:molybdopterin converting factor small subunit